MLNLLYSSSKFYSYPSLSNVSNCTMDYGKGFSMVSPPILCLFIHQDRKCKSHYVTSCLKLSCLTLPKQVGVWSGSIYSQSEAHSPTPFLSFISQQHWITSCTPLRYIIFYLHFFMLSPLHMYNMPFTKVMKRHSVFEKGKLNISVFLLEKWTESNMIYFLFWRDVIGWFYH